MSQEQHILVVDDELAARELVGDYLRMHGFKVTLCDGAKALARRLRNRRPTWWCSTSTCRKKMGSR